MGLPAELERRQAGLDAAYEFHRLIGTPRPRLDQSIICHATGEFGAGVAAANATALDSDLSRLCREQKAVFFERYEAYPENHRLTRFVRSLPVVMANPQIRIVVTRRWDEVNASSFPDGTVFLSDRLIAFCRYQEELEFVIQHEIRHAKDRHVRERFLETSELGAIGRARINEYKADLTDMLKDADTSVNPYGGVVFLERMAASEKEAKSDLAHGGTYTRLINVEHAIHLVDMDALATELAEIPRGLKKGIGKEGDLWKLAKEEANALGFFGALQNFQEIATSNLPAGPKAELVGVLERKIDGEIRSRYPRASDEAVAAMRSFLLLNSPPANPLRPEIYENAQRRLARLVAHSPVLFDEVIPMLATFEASFAVISRAGNLAMIFQRAESRPELVQAPPAAAYRELRRLWEALKQTALGRSNERYSEEETSLAAVLLKTFEPGGKDISGYLDRLEREGLRVDPRALLEGMVSHFRLPADEEERLRHHEFFSSKDRSGFLSQAALTRARRVESLSALINEDIEAKRANEREIRRVAERVAELIDPKTFEDLIDVLSAGVLVSRRKDLEYLVEGRTRHSGWSAVLNYPEVFFPPLLKRLGLTALDNRQAISIMSVLSQPITPQVFMHFEIHRRRFSREELLDLDAILGKAWMIFPSLFILKRTEDQDEALDFLKFVFERGFAEEFSSDLLADNGLDPSASDFAVHVFKKFRFDPKSRKGLDQLLTTSCFIADVELRMRLQKEILKGYLPLLEDRQAYELLFNDRRVADYAAVEAREDYLDRRVTSPAELARIQQEILGRVEGIESELAGAVVLKNELATGLLTDKERLLKALLLTRESNQALRRHIAEVVLARHVIAKDEGEEYALLAEEFGARYASSPADLLPPEIGSADQFEELLYQLGYEARYALCHELLIGEGGVLLEKKKRVELLAWFFDTFIEAPRNEQEKVVHDFLKRVFGTVARQADVRTLYFLIHPVMTERILGAPKQKTTWKAALREAKKTVLSKVCKDPEDRYYYGEELEEAIWILNGFLKGTNDLEGQDLRKTDGETSGQALTLHRLCSPYVGKSEDVVATLSPIAFVKHLASQLGAPGVRFLQSLGLYADLPPELRKEFDEVYDGVKGQFKLTAAHTLQKNGGEPDSLGRRIGGGSMATVYDSTVDGLRCAMKVVNPNLVYRTDTICDTLENIFRSDRSLAPALPLLRNIRAWIRSDVSFDRPEQAEAFIAGNGGFSVPGNEYTLHIPRTIRRGSKHVVEEFVEGRNLTQWEALETGHDLRKVVSLVVKNAVQQVAAGLVHSDMHPGNVRVGDDKKVSWLDNNFLLDLTQRDQEFLGKLALLHGDRQALGREVAAYLSGFEENAGVEREALRSSLVARFLANGYQDIGALVSDVVAIVSEHKGVIPLLVMLLAKNALSLERLARRAGFKSLPEAYQA